MEELVQGLGAKKKGGKKRKKRASEAGRRVSDE